MTSKKTNMVLLGLSTIVLLSAMPLSIQSMSEAYGTQDQPAVNAMPATPTLSSDQQSKLISTAMSVPGVKQWSSSGWEFAGIDYIGTQNPPQWTTAVINLHLPYGKGNPPMQCSASSGSWASIAIDLATNTIKEATFPKAGVNYECNTVHNGPVQASAAMQGVSPLVSTPSFVIAKENDVASSNMFGSWANIRTPSFSTNIYSHMDQNISVLINQLWTTGDFTQLGWTITHTAGCAGAGINANSADLGFVDTSTKAGSVCIFNIPTFTYTGNVNALSQTLCNGGSTYTEQITYNGVTWQHPTNISCSTHQNTDQLNNSVFFENWNTVASSNWSGDVTGTVQASGAKEFVGSTSNIQNWTTSTALQVHCGSSVTNTVLTGSLASAGTAQWQSLSTVPVAC